MGALKRERADRPELTPQDRNRLIPHFEDDVGLLERVTRQPFHDWLDPLRTDGAFSRRIVTRKVSA